MILRSAIGWIGGDLTVSLRNMAGFRNILVHGYDDVDLAAIDFWCDAGPPLEREYDALLADLKR